jgi:hypothetical protein
MKLLTLSIDGRVRNILESKVPDFDAVLQNIARLN